MDHHKFCDDLDGVINNAKNHGIDKIIIPGADPKDLPKAIEICEKYENVFFAVGVHPYDCENFNEAIFEFATHPKCVAIGECGLDYYRLPEDESQKNANKNLQKEVFVSQIQIAKKLSKPLIVHIRDASHDSKVILEKNGAKSVGGVLHCFNASEELLSLANDGFYFGIGGVLTFSNAKKLVQILPKIPKAKLLLETDAPYLTPHPFRGERNEPAMTRFVAQKMGEILGMQTAEVEDLTSANAFNLFKDLK